jgi:hypothetical protein
MSQFSSFQRTNFVFKLAIELCGFFFALWSNSRTRKSLVTEMGGDENNLKIFSSTHEQTLHV